MKLHIFWQKIQAKQESSLTALQLQQDPPVKLYWNLYYLGLEYILKLWLFSGIERALTL